MNAQTKITPAADIDLTEIMRAEQIERITSWLDGLRFSVTLRDGRFGVGRSVGDALAKAKAADAENIKRAA